MVSRHEIGLPTQMSYGTGGLVSIVSYSRPSLMITLVGAFSVIVKTDCETDGSFYSTTHSDTQASPRSILADVFMSDCEWLALN